MITKDWRFLLLGIMAVFMMGMFFVNFGFFNACSLLNHAMFAELIHISLLNLAVSYIDAFMPFMYILHLIPDRRINLGSYLSLTVGRTLLSP